LVPVEKKPFKIEEVKSAMKQHQQQKKEIGLYTSKLPSLQIKTLSTCELKELKVGKMENKKVYKRLCIQLDPEVDVRKTMGKKTDRTV
jgi:hypothetical protein